MIFVFRSNTFNSPDFTEFVLLYHLWQDRVIINRLDSICHAILKGKWPLSSEQYDSPGSLVANSCSTNSAAQHQQRPSFLSTMVSSSVQGQARVQQYNPEQGFSIPSPLTRLPKVRMSQLMTPLFIQTNASVFCPHIYIFFFFI